MNYLVTGGRGFIGCYTVRQLQAGGHNVVCLAHNLDNTSMHEVLTPEQIEQITVVVGQLDNLPFLIKTMQDYKIDVIVHLGGVLGDTGEKDPAETVRVNISGTINIFEAARQTGIKRVVWGSSQTIFGSREFYKELYDVELVPNDAVPKPTLVYGATKVFNEFIAEWYFNKYGLETIGLRYCMVFGVARQRGAGQFATETINKPAEGLPGVVEYGDTAPCWIYVEDAARATVIASQCPNPKTRAFTIGGDITPLADIRDYILTLLPDAQITLKPGIFPAAYNLDVSAAEKELGFKCEYTVFEGVRETINLVREKRNLPRV